LNRGARQVNRIILESDKNSDPFYNILLVWNILQVMFTFEKVCSARHAHPSHWQLLTA